MGAPAIAPALAPAAAAQTPPLSNHPTTADNVRLATVSAASEGNTGRGYFTEAQYASLEKLCDVILPAHKGKPSARQAEVPAFLDFLLSQSEPERQVLYGTGLDQLDINARVKFGRGFGELSDADAGQLLAPLRSKWAYNAPADPLARFLRAAKNDILRATTNSRAFAAANAGSRRATGVNTYWEVVG